MSRATAASHSNEACWISFQAPKGGVGKTTCAFNLAEVAARDGLKVALLDTDMQSTLTKWHRRRPSDARPLLLVTKELARVEEGIAEIEAMPDIDLVLVDTPPAVEYLPDQTKLLIQRSNFVLVPSTTGEADLDSVEGWMELLRKRKVPAAFILNRASMRGAQLPKAEKGERGKRSKVTVTDFEQPGLGTLSYREAVRRLNRAGLLCPIPIRQYEDINRSYGFGIGVAEISNAKGGEDFNGLWDFVRNMAGIPK